MMRKRASAIFRQRSGSSFISSTSGPVMEQLQDWLEAQFTPASGTELRLGQGHYLFTTALEKGCFCGTPARRWTTISAKRALKRVVLHRKNALYYRTLNGAPVGDLFMSLIHTCELVGANPFDYLSELQRHARELADNPSARMPWNYTGQNQ